MYLVHTLIIKYIKVQSVKIYLRMNKQQYISQCCYKFL